jgi:hypothetical protein
VRLRCATEFPFSGHVSWTVQFDGKPRRVPIRFRIPAWSNKTTLKNPGDQFRGVNPGQYYECDRLWRTGDTVEIDFDLSLRLLPGDREAANKVSLYHGPILLAYDQRHNSFDEAEMPLVDPKRLGEARVLLPSQSPAENPLLARLLVDLPTPDNRRLRLCDFASAGATGTRYRSWLPGTNLPPPPPITEAPLDGAASGLGKTAFRWTTRTNATLTNYRVVIGDSPDVAVPLLDFRDVSRPRFDLDDTAKKQLAPGRWYFWRVTAHGPYGDTPGGEPISRFQFDPAKPPNADEP